MKKYFVTAALTAALSVLSGNAFAQVSGSAGVSANHADFSGGDADSYGVDVEAFVPLSGSWSALLAAGFADGDDIKSSLSLSGHLINSGADNAWGFFASVPDTDSSTYVLGGEYGQFFDSSTLAVSLNYGRDDDSDTDAWGLNGAYRIFANDNLRFDLNAGVARGETSGIDADIYSVGAGVEYRFADSPFSVGAGYTHLDGDGPDADIVGVTLRWNFGDQTLKQADRKGATFTNLGSAIQPF